MCRLPVSSDVFHIAAGTRSLRPGIQQNITGALQIICALPARRIVERYREIPQNSCPKPRFNLLPRSQKIALKLITQKSWFNGAPSTAAPLLAAVIPGTTVSSQDGYSALISYMSDAIP